VRTWADRDAWRHGAVRHGRCRSATQAALAAAATRGDVARIAKVAAAAQPT
jgi:hypothetical protein